MDCLRSRRGQKLKKRIALFGGSFDPPHLGHEALVRSALKQLALDELWVIPAGVPVHRRLSKHASAELRMAWVTKMFADDPSVQIKDWEVRQAGSVAAIDTLRQFTRLCPDTVPLWLCGADSFADMETWIEYPGHQRMCNVAVFTRAGDAEPAHLCGWQEISREAWLTGKIDGPGHVVRLDAGLPDISATRLRTMAARGESLQGLVNNRICREIESRYQG